MHKDSKDKRSDEKFFFNTHIFDDGYEDEDAAPVFSEEELESEKKKAFADGLKQGIEDTTRKERESREHTAAQALQRIASETSMLFGHEAQREKIYEAESVALALRIFEVLFPLYREKHGFDELKHNIETVLQKHKKAQKIVIHVSESNTESVKELLSRLTAQGHNGEFDVHGDPALSETACRIAWPQGGAQYDADVMAKEIGSILQQMLAGAPTKGHDSIDGPVTDQDSHTADKPENMENPDE